MNMAAEALICLGSNCAAKQEAVEAAYAFVSGLGTVTADSRIYPTPPEGTPANAEPYSNRVLRLDTALSLEELHAACKEYESGVRSRHSGPGVAVDIDIVACGGKVLRPHDYQSAYMARGLELIRSCKLTITQDGFQR